MFSISRKDVHFSQLASFSREPSPTALERAPYIPDGAAHSRIKSFCLGFLASAMVFIILIGLGGTIAIHNWRPSLSEVAISTGIDPSFCGKSPTEARAAGCRFEVNNFAWLHPDCYDEELDRDWTAGPLAKDLEFWEERGGKGPIPKELVMEGEVELVWVNTRQHRRHCLFVWEKYQRAAMNRRPMDNWTIDYHHTKHCIDLIRDPDNETPDDLVSSYLTLKYPTCDYGPVQLSMDG